MRKLTYLQIKKILERIEMSPNLYIVLLNFSGDKTISRDELNKNVYCINNNYEIIWQIKHDVEPGLFEREPFISLNFNGESLIARDFSGFDFLIDLQTGEIKKTISWNK